MATLILSSVGSAVAGSAGAAIGSYFGRQIDRQFRQSGLTRKLSDLRIQSSQYGTEIPAVIGRMRVAGTVIWASELAQAARVSKSGAQHSYSVSFALALASCPLITVGRMWADGRLIRGAAGDHKIPFSVRLLTGDEDQVPDPLIASFETIERTPAYRGLSLLVFEDFDLSTFGNRLPQITVEVEAEEGAVCPVSLVASLLDLPVSEDVDQPLVHGYALQGDTVADALAPLFETFALPFAAGERGWENGRFAVTHVLDENELAGALVRGEADEQAHGEIPSAISLRYFDATQDFAAGEKSARLPGSQRIRRIEFPGVLTSDEAKAIAHHQLATAWLGKRKLRLSLPVVRASRIRLGDVVALPGRETGRMRVRAMRVDGSAAELLLVEETRTPPPLAADAGTMRRELDEVPVDLELALVELPPTDGTGLGQMAVAVIGGSKPWRRVAVEVSTGGATQQIASADLPGILGRLVNLLQPAPTELIDERNVIDVQLTQDEWLVSVDDSALLAGANLACIGGELLQFGRATALGEGHYHLSRLVRGRYGTFVEAGGHAKGSRFVLVSPERLARFNIPGEMIGSEVAIEATGLNGRSAAATRRFEARSSLPLSPVHLSHAWEGEGLQLSWVRRSRAGAMWPDFVDCPVGESSEAYLIAITDEGGGRLEVVSPAARATLSAEQLASLGPRPWQVEVRQIGDFGASPATYQSIA